MRFAGLVRDQRAGLDLVGHGGILLLIFDLLRRQGRQVSDLVFSFMYGVEHSGFRAFGGHAAAPSCGHLKVPVVPGLRGD